MMSDDNLKCSALSAREFAATFDTFHGMKVIEGDRHDATARGGGEAEPRYLEHYVRTGGR
jgi:hypothetical protein